MNPEFLLEHTMITSGNLRQFFRLCEENSKPIVDKQADKITKLTPLAWG
jgi:hypothetical protein